MALLLLLLALAGIAVWSGKRGHLDGAGGIRLAMMLGLVAVVMLVKGQFAGAAAAGAIAAWISMRKPRKAPPASSIMIEEARALLGVSADADEATIRAAHRSLVARVHPDTGGTADLARRVNAARDTLLAAPHAER